MLADLGAPAVDEARASDLKGRIRRENYVSGAAGAGGNWAKGHYGEGAELVETVLDAVRRKAEGCERLAGFQLAHAASGVRGRMSAAFAPTGTGPSSSAWRPEGRLGRQHQPCGEGTRYTGSRVPAR